MASFHSSGAFEVLDFTGAHTNDDDAQPFFRQAIELGITFWDTANVYQAGTSEEVTGRAIRRYSRREDVVRPGCCATRPSAPRLSARPGRITCPKPSPRSS